MVIAREFGASKTPHVYLFDKNDELVYRGAIDDNANKARKVKKPYVANAIDAMLNGNDIKYASTKAFVFNFFLTLFNTDPKDGAKKGIQYLKITKSGLSSIILLAVFFHEIGLTELNIRSVSYGTVAGDSLNCEFPGNRKSGY